jgi:hypothetical protein
VSGWLKRYSHIKVLIICIGWLVQLLQKLCFLIKIATIYMACTSERYRYGDSISYEADFKSCKIIYSSYTIFWYELLISCLLEDLLSTC